MNTNGLILLISEKADPERDAVAGAWTNRGGSVMRLGRFWDPPELNAGAVRLYGNESFCTVLAQKLGLELVSPADDQLVSINQEFLARRVEKTRVSQIQNIPAPAFVKSLVPKLIASRIYGTHAQLKAACAGLDDSTELLVADPIEIVAEARCFVLGGIVLDGAFYEGHADLVAARAFAARVAQETKLHRAFVVDVGLLRNGRWAVIEFNAAWGAGLNGCDPAKILPAIEAAVSPR